MNFTKIALCAASLFAFQAVYSSEVGNQAQGPTGHANENAVNVLGYAPLYTQRSRFVTRNEAGELQYAHVQMQIPATYVDRLEADARRLVEENAFLRSLLLREQINYDKESQNLGYLRTVQEGTPVDASTRAVTNVAIGYNAWKDIALGATAAGTIVFGTLYVLERNKPRN